MSGMGGKTAQEKIPVAVVGPGNIGIDLMKKILNRSRWMRLVYVAGIVEDSPGLRFAAQAGIRTSNRGIGELLDDGGIRIVFEATGAQAHIHNAPLYRAAGKLAVDLTPAAVGPYVVPAVNLPEGLEHDNVNLVTCGGQATVPIVHAIGSVQSVEYAEIVSTIASKSAGPGTRQNIDEFTQTTARALERVGGARRAKAIIILNPADPPIMMRNTIYCRVREPDMDAVTRAVERRVAELQEYVPGYEMTMPPTWDGEKITVMIQVRGSGDYLPSYAGNLDIITCAALRIGDRFAQKLLGAAEEARP